MASVNQKIQTALSDLVSGNIWPLSKPPEEDPDVYIVYNPSLETAEDYGDDIDHEWQDYIQVHWYARGRVNYLSTKKSIRSRLRNAGFALSEIAVIEHDSDGGSGSSGIGWTHLCFSCSIVEDDPYGES